MICITKKLEKKKLNDNLLWFKITSNSKPYDVDIQSDHEISSFSLFDYDLYHNERIIKRINLIYHQFNNLLLLFLFCHTSRVNEVRNKMMSDRGVQQQSIIIIS
jgi:hypothetical protein